MAPSAEKKISIIPFLTRREYRRRLAGKTLTILEPAVISGEISAEEMQGITRILTGQPGAVAVGVVTVQRLLEGNLLEPLGETNRSEDMKLPGLKDLRRTVVGDEEIDVRVYAYKIRLPSITPKGFRRMKYPILSVQTDESGRFDFEHWTFS